MNATPDEFLRYWMRIRQRTLAVADCVPADRLDWSAGRGAMTIGDLLRHIAVTERWLFVEIACGRPSRYVVHDSTVAQSSGDIRALLVRLHDESTQLVSAFTAPQWQARVTPPGGASLPAWKWLRAMCEHEVHHRGQLYLMLRLLDVPTPPIFGLTSEQVRG